MHRYGPTSGVFVMSCVLLGSNPTLNQGQYRSALEFAATDHRDPRGGPMHERLSPMLVYSETSEIVPPRNR